MGEKERRMKKESEMKKGDEDMKEEGPQTESEMLRDKREKERYKRTR